MVLCSFPYESIETGAPVAHRSSTGLLIWRSQVRAPFGGGNIFDRDRGSIVHYPSSSPSNRPDMTEIMLKRA